MCPGRPPLSHSLILAALFSPILSSRRSKKLKIAPHKPKPSLVHLPLSLPPLAPWAQRKQSSLSEEGTQWARAKCWEMLGCGCGADVPREPRGFLGWWGGGAQRFSSHPPLNVVFLLFCFLVSYEESSPKDPAAVTESKEGTEASASKGLEKKEK